LKRTKAVVDATIAKNDTPNTSADVASHAGECPKNGSAALGGRPWRRDRICPRATQNIAAAMSRHGIKRIVAISTFGAGEARAHAGWLVRTLLFGVVLGNEVADKEQMERLLAASDLDWTVVRVGRLTDGPARNAWRAADDGSIRTLGSIARAGVAAFMVAQIQDSRWVRRKPVLVD